MHRLFFRPMASEQLKASVINNCCYPILGVVFFGLFVANACMYDRYQSCEVRVDILADALLLLSTVWMQRGLTDMLRCCRSNGEPRKCYILAMHCLRVTLGLMYVTGVVGILVQAIKNQLGCATGGFMFLSHFMVMVIGTGVFASLIGMRCFADRVNVGGGRVGTDVGNAQAGDAELVARNAELNVRIREQEEENRRLQGIIPALEGRVQVGNFGYLCLILAILQM